MRHRVAAGETLESIADQYHLLPVTLVGMNPDLNQPLSVGQSLVIPPFNGTAVEVAPGQTWQTLADRYQVQADLLFELNGCQATVPSRIFVPGVNWFAGSANPAAGQSAAAVLTGYPLPTTAPILIGYGWQPHPEKDEMVFNSGIALSVAANTRVLAVGDGTVAFAGYQEGYGNLVVVNHPQGLQTRYANLDQVSVSVGQAVRSGSSLGTVGRTDSQSFLYFEVRTNSDMGWVAQDPGQYISALEIR
jgi:lysostaphin